MKKNDIAGDFVKFFTVCGAGVHPCVNALRGTHVAVRGQPAGLPSIMRGLRIKLGLPELAATTESSYWPVTSNF